MDAPSGRKEKIVVVMPAYNAERTLRSTVASIPGDLGSEILVVDDASSDGTVALARSMALTVVQHESNLGYGGNQKTCYRHALQMGADIVVMVHPDDQYDARLIPSLILPIQLGVCDVMLGNRIRTRAEALRGGMPVYKYFANRLLTILENVALGQNLGEFHSGMRAYGRKVLETIPWQNNSDDFVFDQEFLVQAAYFRFRIGDVPVPVRYFKEASSIGFWRSCRYCFQTLVTLVRYALAEAGLLHSPAFPKTVRTAVSEVPGEARIART
ncbi:MAG: Undecaprenyl-phosphate mannosyltransferase [Candidatus Krumholzibacteriota bacterium]|nr:Undecaprenyl-phosphate mannosyltransferase [Candidatus Krumholzibacteriota bacterium]